MTDDELDAIEKRTRDHLRPCEEACYIRSYDRRGRHKDTVLRCQCVNRHNVSIGFRAGYEETLALVAMVHERDEESARLRAAVSRFRDAAHCGGCGSLFGCDGGAELSEERDALNALFADARKNNTDVSEAAYDDACDEALGIRR